MVGNTSLLKDLYLLTRSKINKEPVKASSQISMDRQKNVINQIDIKEHQSLIIEHFKNFDDSYFNKNSSTEHLKWQSELIIKNHDDDFIIGSKSKFENFIEIFIKAKDSPGLFYKLLKVLEHAGLEVIDANIFTSIKKEFAANTFITKYSRHDRVLKMS